MLWDRFWTYLISAGMAGLGGLWLYLKTHKKRNPVDAFICFGWAMLTGAAVAMLLCWKLCRDDESEAVVVAICTLSGLTGLTPTSVLVIVRNILIRSAPDNEPGKVREPYPDPPSD